ncbi:MAG TPA: MBL fold metallo-hydrolase RNA specificity domain-containing protein [Candidatus Paceibacterota bacterium]
MISMTSHGGADTVTGARFIYKHNNTSILLDCGMFQGNFREKDNGKFTFNINEITAVSISHAHLDHIGALLFLIDQGYRGPIHSTPPTKDLTEIMLIDQLKIHNQNNPEDKLPISTVETVMSLWTTHEYHQPFTIEQTTLTYFDAGHILGSALTLVESEGVKTLYTGDMGNSPTQLLKDTEEVGADFVFTECVYGSREHEASGSREEQLKRAITGPLTHGHTVLIPVFSLERSQEILYTLDHLIEEEQIHRVPVFFDTPLGQKVTAIYESYPEYLNQDSQNELKHDDIFNFPGLKVIQTADESEALKKQKGPRIILAGSGMSHGGRILSLYQTMLKQKDVTVVFVGYQAPGTLGRRLQDGVKVVELQDKTVHVNAQFDTVTGYSGHRDVNGLVSFIEHLPKKPKKVFTILGEPSSCNFLAQRIKFHLGIDAAVMEYGKENVLKQ